MTSQQATLPQSAAAHTSLSTPRGGLHVSLWVAQGLLAAMFLMSGFMKATAPVEELSKMMSVPTVLGETMTRFIGISEILGAIGLILPAATRIRPGLTPLAAAALALVMLLATLFHVTQSEFGAMPMTLVLGGIAAFVAWGRYVGAPIPERNG